ncbi:MAG: oligopeptidase A, partial [Gammaproteobacteria bacterium]
SKLSEYHTEVGQNETLYQIYEQLRDSTEYNSYSCAQRAVIKQALRDFRLSGVGLDEQAKTRYKTLASELSALTSRFSQNVLDAGQAWSKRVTDEQSLAGLPKAALDLTAQNAKRTGVSGWVLNLDYPVYSAVMSYAHNRDLREELYTAYTTRASDQGPNAGQWDNSDLIEDILAKRHELANVVGFANYAEYSLARKMADSPAQVREFLDGLGRHSKPVAEAEYRELTDYASAELKLSPLQAWDVSYVSEHLRKARFDISPEELRPYFPMPGVLQGLFEIVRRLFSINVVAKTDVAVWDPSVQFFEIQTTAGDPIGQFYLDAYARTGKRGGAWMDECVVRRRTSSGVQLPVAYLNCNFSPPTPSRPSLLTHSEVLTLFHEFGHGLHHLLTRVDHGAVSGINGVPWDAVELPSQFLENWCWVEEGLALISGHFESGDPLPDALVGRLRNARNFLSGLAMVRQLEFSLFDLRIHADYTPESPTPIGTTLAQVRNEICVVPTPQFNRFSHAFTHIFAGGYAAGYYSYKWAEVLAADAFGRFEECGVFDQVSGEAFRDQVLARGGSEDAMELFRAFRGREPDVGALLRQCGIDRTSTSP